MDVLTRFLEKNMRHALHDVEQEVEHRVRNVVRRVKYSIMKDLVVLGLFMIATMLLLITLFFAGTEYLHLSRTLVTLMLTFLTFFVGLIVKLI